VLYRTLNRTQLTEVTGAVMTGAVCCSSVSLRRCVLWGSYAARWWWGLAVAGKHSMSFWSRTTRVEVGFTLC